MPAHLRIVRNGDDGGEGENERGQQQTEPQRSDGVQVDPRLAAFLEKHAISSRAGRVGIFRPDEVVVLKSETLGRAFSQSEIDVIERWLIKHDPYQGGSTDVKVRLSHLDRFVNGELAHVGNASWLYGALEGFERVLNQKRRERNADITFSVVRAVFVALLTIHPPR